MNKLVIVLPAYNAESTLESVLQQVPRELEADLVLCDDASSDNTLSLARQHPITTLKHNHNQGYGANQKSLLCAGARVRLDCNAAPRRSV